MSLEVLDIEKMIVIKQKQKTCKCIFRHYTSWLMKVNVFLGGFFQSFFYLLPHKINMANPDCSVLFGSDAHLWSL